MTYPRQGETWHSRDKMEDVTVLGTANVVQDAYRWTDHVPCVVYHDSKGRLGSKPIGAWDATMRPGPATESALTAKQRIKAGAESLKSTPASEVVEVEGTLYPSVKRVLQEARARGYTGGYQTLLGRVKRGMRTWAELAAAPAPSAASVKHSAGSAKRREAKKQEVADAIAAVEARREELRRKQLEQDNEGDDD